MKCAKRMLVVLMTLAMLLTNVRAVAVEEATEAAALMVLEPQTVSGNDAASSGEGGSPEQAGDDDGLEDGELSDDLLPSDNDELSENDNSSSADLDDHQHDWLEDWECSAEHHWHECGAENCDATENSQKDGYAEHCYHDGVCAKCGYFEIRQNDENDEPSGGDNLVAHVHVWLMEWTRDEDHHWHECANKDCTATENDEKNSYAKHEFGEGETECTECGYLVEVEEEIPEHEHAFSSEWAGDDFFHWHECEAEGCTIVEDDGKDGYGEHVYFDEDESWFGDELVCQICGYDATELFAVLGEMGLYAEYPKPPVNLPDAPAQSYKEAFNRIVAAMNDYPEGLRWTSYEPYSLIDPYYWQTYVRVPGYGKVNRGVGCAGFAFIMSDLAFKDLPARLYTRGQFKLEDVKVGDIIRYDTGRSEHVVIVLQVSDGGVIVTEGNYNSSVHWGRVLSREQVESAYYFITRWPEGYVDPDAEGADEVVGSGTDGGLDWQITRGGTLTISGIGAMPDYTLADSKSTAPWSDLNVSSVIIEGGVTSIGEYAFYKSTVLNVYIPEGVTTIGQSAFEESTLVSVTIPGSVETIGKKAFAFCQNLVSASISDGVVTIGEQAFRGCEIKYIDFPATIESVGAGAFMSCQQLTQVRFAPGTKKVAMGDNMFSQCWYLSSVLLPEGADRISAGMFESCSKLKKICVPKGVSEIGDKAFTQCPYLSLEGNGIFFEGNEQQWNDIGGKAIQIWTQPHVANVYFDQIFDNPFAVDPNVTDLIGEELCANGHVGTADADNNCSVCGKPMDTAPVDPDPIGPEPIKHSHAWSFDWRSNDRYHWHECQAADCTVADIASMDGYAGHCYGDWVIDADATADTAGSKHQDCTVCGYRQTESIPAKGGSTGGNPEDSNPTPSESGIPSASVTPNPEQPETPNESETPNEPKAPDETEVPKESESSSGTNETENSTIPEATTNPTDTSSTAANPTASANPNIKESTPTGTPTKTPASDETESSSAENGESLESGSDYTAELSGNDPDEAARQESESAFPESSNPPQTDDDPSIPDASDASSDARMINMPIMIAAIVMLIGIAAGGSLIRFKHQSGSED